MKQKHPVVFYIFVVSICFAGFFTAHALNRIPVGLPTIQEMQKVILQHPLGGAMTVIDFYPKKSELHIWIDQPLSLGTDGTNKAFSQIIWNLMTLDDRLLITVDGEWIPSRQNPIDFAWAKVLKESGPY